MEFRFAGVEKYVNISEVAEFLAYKRVKGFIDRVKEKCDIILDTFANVKDIIKLLVGLKRKGISELVDILLGEKEQEEVDNIVSEFNKKTNNEFCWISDSKEIPKSLKNLWYIISAFNIGIVGNDTVVRFINYYKTNLYELEGLFVDYMQNLPYKTVLDDGVNIIWKIKGE